MCACVLSRVCVCLFHVGFSKKKPGIYLFSFDWKHMRYAFYSTFNCFRFPMSVCVLVCFQRHVKPRRNWFRHVYYLTIVYHSDGMTNFRRVCTYCRHKFWNELFGICTEWNKSTYFGFGYSCKQGV